MRSFFFNIRRPAASHGAPAVVYFVPHQDDELLTLGVDACRTMMNTQQPAYIVLCTDGSKSGVRKRLNNGKSCGLHDEPHCYALELSEFVAARDAEFRDSCAALGYAPERVMILENRGVDGALDVETAEKLMLQVLAKLPRDTQVCTISPQVGSTQHADHTALGQAAVNLYHKGYIRDLRLFVEPYCLDACRAEHPELVLETVMGDAAVQKRVKKAIAAYSLWAPQQGRYAVGRHSVAKEFAAFAAAPAGYFHRPTKS